MKFWRACNVLVLAALVALPGMAGCTSTEERPPRASQVLLHLDTAEPAEREAALQEFAAFVALWNKPELLQQAAFATKDAALKSALELRAETLRSQRQRTSDATPPISLSLKDASMAQVMQALNKATGTQWLTNSVVQTDGVVYDRYTLDVRDKPVWDVFLALREQHGLVLMPRFRMSPTNDTNPPTAVDGPVIAFVSQVRLQRSADLLAPVSPRPGMSSGSSSALRAEVTMVVDPRIRVAGYRTHVVVRAVDNLGHDLALASYPAQFEPNSDDLNKQPISFKLPPQNIRTFSFTCVSSILAETRELSLTIPDVAKNLNKPFVVGNHTFAITLFDGKSIAVEETGQPSASETMELVTYRLIDSRGQRTWDSTGPGNAASNTLRTGTGPYALEIHLPDGEYEIPVRLEFKDIPLP